MNVWQWLGLANLVFCGVVVALFIRLRVKGEKHVPLPLVAALLAVVLFSAVLGRLM